MRKYTAGITATSIAVAQDLVAITAPSTGVICITRAWVTQSGNVTSEQNLAVLQRVSTNNTSGATSLTPRKMEMGDPSSVATVYSVPTVLNTLIGDPHVHEGFNWVSGFLWVPAPEERMFLAPSGIAVLRLINNPSAAKIIDAGINFIELG